MQKRLGKKVYRKMPTMQYVKDAFYYDRTVRKMERRLQQRNLLFVIR